jgi:hypothetical protein
MNRLQEETSGKPCPLRTGELLRHVLFPTDFSSVGNGAVMVVKKLIPLGVAEMTILHALEVMEPCPAAVMAPAEEAAISLQEILDRIVEPTEVKAAVKAGMMQTLGAVFQEGELLAEELNMAREIASQYQIHQ